MQIRQSENELLEKGQKLEIAIAADSIDTYLSVCQDRIRDCIEFPICIHDCLLTFLIHIILKSNKRRMV